MSDRFVFACILAGLAIVSIILIIIKIVSNDKEK